MYHTIDFCANFRISLMAFGARFLKVVPWSYTEVRIPSPTEIAATRPGGRISGATYPLMKVDGVFASDNISDGAAALARRLLS